MKWLLRLINFLTYSSIWVALSVASLTKITAYNLGFSTENNLVLFVFFSTVIGYNFVKHYSPDKSIFTITKKWQPFLNGVSFCLAVFYFFQLKWQTQLTVSIPFLITVFYTISFGNKTLRNISGIKVSAIALSWVFVTTVLPMVENGFMFTTDFFIECVQRYAFVFAITLPFEIRDLAFDDSNLGTITQRIGVRNTKLYGIILLMLFLLLEFFKDNIPEQNLIILPIIFLISLLLLVLTNKNQSKFYTNFLVEGIPVFWLVLWSVV